MQPESSPEALDQELAARLSALDEEHARAGSVDPCELTAGLPPEAAARLEGALEGLARLQVRWPQSRETDDVPRPFGKFVIERELGRGGHGIVFLALDPALNRRVALKIPRPELIDDPDWRRRFLREGQAVARLDHPDIIPILELGEVGSICYIASPYCQGPDLAAWLKGRTTPLGPRAAAGLALVIADAVGHAHARGVVHRDLKPRNILMEPVGPCGAPDDPGARPRVTDFGLAKLIEAGSELTRTGIVLGTPRYMAPEQVQARHALIGPPTDVYAIGTILEELLTARGVVLDDGPYEASPPREASPSRPVPRELRAIVARCLEPEPPRRYADAAALAADLNCFLDGRRVHAAGFSPSAFLARTRRHLALAATLLIAILLVAVASVGRRRTQGPDSTRTLAPSPQPMPTLAERLARERGYVADLRLIDRLAPRDWISTTSKLVEARALLDRYRPRAGEDDLRTWEWYYFGLLLHGERKSLAGHRGEVYHLSYSDDGSSLASSGKDGVRLWDMETGKIRLTLHEHADDVNWVSFAPDGKRLATASDDRSVRVWSAGDGRRLLRPLVHQNKVVAVLFTPDGRHLISGDRGGTATIWDATTGTLIQARSVSGLALEGMALSPDGSVLAIATGNEVSLWDYPALRRRIPPIPADPGHHFDCVAFSHDGRRFATASGSRKSVRIWDTPTGRLLHALIHDAEERVMSVAFSPDDRMLLSTGSDQAGRLWDLTTAGCDCKGMLAGHTDWVWDGAFAPDGRTVATAGKDGTIKLWDIPHRGVVIPFELGSSPCLAMAYSSDPALLYTATGAGDLNAWDPATGRDRGRLPFRPSKPSVEAAFAPGASLVAIADAEGTISVGSPRRGDPDVILPRAAAGKPCLAFSADARILAYVTRDGSVGRLEVAAPHRRLEPLRWPRSAPTCLAFSPDGGLIAGGAEGRWVACDLNTGAIREAPERAHRGEVTCLAFSRDGTLCVTGGEDSIVSWETRSMRVRVRLQGHSRSVSDLAFTPDGRTLISASEDGKIDLWNGLTSQPTLVLASGFFGLEQDIPSCIAVAADGSSIAAVSNKPSTTSGRFWLAARPETE